MKLSKYMILFVSILIFLTMMMNSKMKKNISKQFFWNVECGFNNNMFKTFKISLNFFIIMIIFVIFDLEMAMMMPIIMNVSKKKTISFSLLLISFMLFLMFTMIYEIKFKSLMWK